MIPPLYSPERLAQIERKSEEADRRAREQIARLRVMGASIASGKPVVRRWLPFHSRGRLMLAADLGLDE